MTIENTGQALEQGALDETLNADTIEGNQNTTQDNSETPESPDTPESDTAQDTQGNVTDDAIAARKSTLLSRVGKIGQEDGTGKKALLNFAETIVEGAMDMAIVEDDAERFYKRFKDASNKKATLDNGVSAVPEDNEKSVKSQVSKIKTLIRLGRGFRDDDAKATDIVRRARDLHIALMNAPEEKKLLKLKSTYAAMLAVAAEQMRDGGGKHAGVPLTDEQMREVLQGQEKAPKTGLDLILIALTNAEKAAKGKDATEDDEGRAAVEHDELTNAIAALRSVLADLDPDTLAEHDKKATKKEESEAVAAFKIKRFR